MPSFAKREPSETPFFIDCELQYGRSFNPRKVYYFNKHAKFLSKLSMILATLARIIDFHAGKTISGLLAPHKIMVYEKRS